MSDKSIIAWTTHTANFWMGCAKVSGGCAHCYAETLTTNRMGLSVWGPSAPRQPVKGIWENVEKWNRQAQASGERTKTFCMSLGDFFEDHPTANALRPRAWSAIRLATWLDWQILTKRPENIARMLPDDWRDGWPHVWLGTSIESERYADRARTLAAIPAAVRFISYEPALGPIAHAVDLRGIHWLICGGESGPGFRRMDVKWARDIRDECTRNGVAFFFKQSSAFRTEMGTQLDGHTIRQFPCQRATSREWHRALDRGSLPQGNTATNRTRTPSIARANGQDSIKAAQPKRNRGRKAPTQNHENHDQTSERNARQPPRRAKNPDRGRG